MKGIRSLKCRQTTQNFRHVFKHFVKMILEGNRSFIFVLIIWIHVERGKGDEHREEGNGFEMSEMKSTEEDKHSGESKDIFNSIFNFY